MLANQIADVAAATQTPPDLAGTMGLAVLAYLGSRRVDVAVGSTHHEPLNQYCAAIAASGTRKGPAQRAMSKPLRRLLKLEQDKKAPEIAHALERHRAEEKELEHLRGLRAKEDDPASRTTIDERIKTLVETRKPLPVWPQWLVSDRTPEKLEQDLMQQGGRLLIEDEEAATLLANAGGRYGRDGVAQMDVFLKARDRGVIDTDRLGRDRVHVETPELSIAITPQPILLQQLRERPEFHHRGLLPRFLFSMPRSLVGSRLSASRCAPTATVREAYASTVQRLFQGLAEKRDGEELEHLILDGAALGRSGRPIPIASKSRCGTAVGCPPSPNGRASSRAG